jgi:hypothetical protein
VPIEFSCDSCGKRLRVKDESAGKRVKCPGCQTILRVPGKVAADSSASGSSVGGASAAGPAAEQWYAKTDDGQTYGPVSRQELDEWAAEGRLTAESQILRDGSDQWQWATDLYPQLAQAQPAAGGQSDNPFAFIDTGGGGAATPGYSAGGAAAHYGGGQVSSKSKIAAGLLGIFLGAFGIHRFYLGFTGIGILQLVLFFLTCGMSQLWGFIEGILILVGTMDRDAQGRVLRD